MNTSLIKVNRYVATVTALAFSFYITNSALAAPPKAGDAFPDLTKYGLEGTLPDLHGKVVLVDFFASWCGPCKESFPAMQELQEKYGDKGLVIVAVNLDKKKEDMEGFLKEHPATFTIVRDAANKLVSELKIPTMPSSFLLDRNGKVHAFHRGFKGAETKKEYTEEIESLLK
jgi:cytochrome c biogenesis protein CcmG/thiol:disulfide interchange protein DsbE